MLGAGNGRGPRGLDPLPDAASPVEKEQSVWFFVCEVSSSTEKGNLRKNQDTGSCFGFISQSWILGDNTCMCPTPRLRPEKRG